MEERIIDDEYGRGIRLKKTKDGYVDATEEKKDEDLEDENESIVKDTEEVRENEEETSDEVAEEAEDEVLFRFPELEEDDEELATLTPQQAEELKRKREEERRKKEEEYHKNVADGNAYLAEKNFEEATKKFYTALAGAYDEGSEAAIGLCLADTKNFENPDALAELYENDYEEFSSAMGETAQKTIVKNYGETIKKRIAEIEKEEKPLEEKVLKKQTERRQVLSPRLKKDKIGFFVSLFPTIIFLALTIVFAVMIPTRADNAFVIATAVLDGIFVVAFLILMGLSNKLINTLRIYRENENLAYTEEGKKLVLLRDKKEFFSSFFEEENQ